MEKVVLWSIGSPDGHSEQLVDNYKEPKLLENVHYHVDDASTDKWPLFHPSEADPDSGYCLHPYKISFQLEEEPVGTYLFQIHYLVIAPRVAYLEVAVNGVKGNAYLRPEPSKSGDITLHSGLHTTIYSEGILEIRVPSSFLRQGENVIELISRDSGDYLLIDNLEKIKRLDRMANGAGFIYQCLTFSKLERLTEDPFARVELKPSVLYKKSEGNLVELCHFYLELNEPLEETTLTIKYKGNKAWRYVEVPLQAAYYGHIHLPFYIEDDDGPLLFEIKGNVNGNPYYKEGSVKRKRKWKVYLTPHAHTDIGYTHRQWEVAERLCRNLDTAIDYLDKMGEEKGHPPAFAYHLDASWVLETYLETRSQRQTQKLFDYIKAGKIGIPHSYVDVLTQLASTEELIRNGVYSEEILRSEGIRASFNSIVDVPSLSGSLPAIYEGSGVNYLVHANNQDRGPFRLNGGLHKASPFYWEGVNGGKVLVWLSKMYCELRKVCGSPPVNSSAERGLEMWLQEYETESYKPDAVLLYGQEADNTDLDPQPIEFTKGWNTTYEYPRLIACEPTEFFEYVETHFKDTFPTVKGDGGAYWEDGAGSTIAETIMIRQAQAMLPAAEKLEALAVIHNPLFNYPEKQFREAWHTNLLFVEHTWGAFLSATDPEALLQKDQWDVKKHFAEKGLQASKRLLQTAAVRHSLNWNTDGREIVVYNPHSFGVSGPVSVEIGRHERVYEFEGGTEIPLRVIKQTPTQALVEVFVDHLPGFSYRRFKLTASEPHHDVRDHNGFVIKETEKTVSIENVYYALTFDLEQGVLTRLLDKELQKELLHSEAGFGQFLYAKGGEGTRLVGNSKDLKEGQATIIKSFILLDYKIESYSHGVSLHVTGEVPEGVLQIEWRLLKAAKQLDVTYSYQKNDVLAKEAVYIAFPFNLEEGDIRSDSQVGWVNWDQDELPGACKEWLPLQTSILIESKEATIQIASPSIPLFTVGQPVQGRWPKSLKLTGHTVYSYVLNNYWNTNYKASQSGLIEFRYSLTSQASISNQEAYAFGWKARQPLYAHRISFQDFREPQAPYYDQPEGTLASIDTEKVVISTIKKANRGQSWILRFQEISGETHSPVLTLPGQRIKEAWLTDLLEREIQRLDVIEGVPKFSMEPWSLVTLRVELEDQTEL